MTTTKPLEGKTLCFTGTLTTQTRAQASAAAKANGAKVTSSISGATSVLVIGPTGAGSKVKVAEAKGIEVWTEEQFNEFIGGAPVAAKKSPPKKRAAAKKAPQTPPKKKSKAAASAAKTPPPSSKKKIAPATPGEPGSALRKVMSAVPNGNEEYSVYQDYDVKLMLSDSHNANSNKFYKLQMLTKDDTEEFYVATNWGRLGVAGQSQLKGPFGDEATAFKEFGKVFRNKTKNAWGAEPFVRHVDKYQIVETTQGDDDGGDDAALGRLTEAQIHKGQAVLKELRALFESTASKTSRGRKVSTKNQDEETIGRLSNDFYSLIPTTSGFKRPPPLDNLEIVTEKEGLLEFWLRMGFEEVTEGTGDGSPIDGVLDLPVPATLKAAASRITDSYSIDESRKRGQSLAKEAATTNGGMTADLYGAILLYTGNSIYREINRCLRTEWPSVRKYYNYLRLYFEAMEKMPIKEVTLWRGIAADLYNEYVVGKVITWWSISSCTADQQVAQNFMNQLGGSSAATLLTLHTKRACDISGLSFCPHEQESLLRPGTKLRVLSRKRNGKVAEIEVEEVVEDDEDDRKVAAR